MRDFLMDEQYFQDFIAEETARVERFSGKLSRGEIRPDRVESVERRVYGLNFGIWIARYSKGEALSSLQKDFDEIFNAFPRFCSQTSSYLNLLWLIALGVLLNVDSARFSEVSRTLEKCGRQDALLDFFCGYKMRGSTSLENHVFTCPKPFAALGRVIEQEEQRAERLKHYVETQWYPGLKPFGLCGVHKAKEKLYSGYWSFESSAVAKILGLDDSALKGIPYYPYDLAHFSSGTS